MKDSRNLWERYILNMPAMPLPGLMTKTKVSWLDNSQVCNMMAMASLDRKGREGGQLIRLLIITSWYLQTDSCPWSRIVCCHDLASLPPSHHALALAFSGAQGGDNTVVENLPLSSITILHCIVHSQIVISLKLGYHPVCKCPEDEGVSHPDSSDSGSMLAAAVCILP